MEKTSHRESWSNFLENLNACEAEYSERDFYMWCQGRDFGFKEIEAERLYSELLESGLSDSEARGTAYKTAR